MKGRVELVFVLFLLQFFNSLNAQCPNGCQVNCGLCICPEVFETKSELGECPSRYPYVCGDLNERRDKCRCQTVYSLPNSRLKIDNKQHHIDDANTDTDTAQTETNSSLGKKRQVDQICPANCELKCGLCFCGSVLRRMHSNGTCSKGYYSYCLPSNVNGYCECFYLIFPSSSAIPFADASSSINTDETAEKEEKESANSDDKRRHLIL